MHGLFQGLVGLSRNADRAGWDFNYVKTDITKKTGATTTGLGSLGRRLALGAALVALVSSSGGSIAQTVPDDATPAVGLDIPKNLQIFGKVDPNVRKPTAIVNGAVITGTDIDQRVALLVAARDLKLSPEEMAQYKLLTARQLIDETLQIQQAKTAEVKIAPD